MSVAVVYDAELLVVATAFAGSSWLEWPAVPPVTNNPEQDCLGVIASAVMYGGDFSLVVSRDLLGQVEVALRDDVGLRDDDISDYLVAVLSLAAQSGGSVVADPQNPTTGAGPAVDVPLRLAASPRRLLVAANPLLQQLGPRWGPEDVPILGPRDFALRADAARRARRQV